MHYRSLLLVVLAFLLTPLIITTEAASITRTIGDRFEITVGYLHEPAILGDTNAMRIAITENGEPVAGIATDLHGQIEFSEAVRALSIVESSTEPGVYTATFIPMMDGSYAFTLTGTIDGVEINERYTVDDGLVNVQPRTDFEFPNAANGFRNVTRLAMPTAALLVGGLVFLTWRRRTA